MHEFVVLRLPDLLRNIFTFLDVVGVCRAAAVCKDWRRVSDSDEFWVDVCFKGRRITGQQVRTSV